MRFLFRLDLSLHAGAGKKFEILNFVTKHGLNFICSRVPPTEKLKVPAGRPAASWFDQRTNIPLPVPTRARRVRGQVVP